MLSLIQTLLVSQVRCSRRCEKKSAVTNAERRAESIEDAASTSSLQASTVLTRNELLAMMPRGKRRTSEMEAACLPAMMPCSSPARNVTVMLEQARRPGKGEAALVPFETPITSASRTLAPQAAGVPTSEYSHPSSSAESTAALLPANEDCGFQTRVLAATEKLSGLGEGARAGPEVIRLMSELEELAQRISKADEMVQQASVGSPAKDGEAAKWHEVALVTLKWSQQELLRRQRAALLRLVEIAEWHGENCEVLVPSLDSSTPISSAVEQSVSFVLQDSITGLPAERSMKKDLEALRLHDPECILILRKIKKLGWESPALLRKHMEQFGMVREAFVTHSMMKPNPKRPGGRARPAALGFIVMANKEGRTAVLSRGEVHRVFGFDIEVAAFNPFLDCQLDAPTV